MLIVTRRLTIEADYFDTSRESYGRHPGQQGVQIQAMKEVRRKSLDKVHFGYISYTVVLYFQQNVEIIHPCN